MAEFVEKGRKEAMRYIPYNGLTVIRLQRDREKIPYVELVEIIYERPSNIIYCELNEKLYGIISMGDIWRSKTVNGNEKDVAINKNFMCVLQNEYMLAKTTFDKNPNINAIPVVTRGGFARLLYKMV